MEAIRVTDKEWEIAGVHYVRTEAMCNGFGVSLEMEFGEDKAGDEYILVLDVSIRYRPADCISWMKIPERLKESQHLRNTADSIMEQRQSLRQKSGLQNAV